MNLRLCPPLDKLRPSSWKMTLSSCDTAQRNDCCVDAAKMLHLQCMKWNVHIFIWTCSVWVWLFMSSSVKHREEHTVLQNANSSHHSFMFCIPYAILLVTVCVDCRGHVVRTACIPYGTSKYTGKSVNHQSHEKMPFLKRLIGFLNHTLCKHATDCLNRYFLCEIAKKCHSFILSCILNSSLHQNSKCCFISNI